ncbi:MAG: hypothetical protein U0176_22620 [Bacteroidia bacterium]
MSCIRAVLSCPERPGIPVKTQGRLLVLPLALAMAFLAALGSVGQAQNLEKLDLHKPVTVSGSAGLNLGFYTAFGAPTRKDPFQWLANANLTFKVLNMVTIPFSANFSQQNQSFMQPFNQYGASPKYKWVTGHLGYRNLTFSQLGLAGHTFLGAGVEMNPGKWRIGACYGRFRRAVSLEEANANGVDISFRRMGYAAKVGYGTTSDYIDLTMLKAWDALSSVKINSDSLEAVTPEENLVWTVAGKKTIAKKLVVEGEYGRTAITRDTRALTIQSGTPYDGLGSFFTPRASTIYRGAFLGGIGYTGGSYSVKLAYKRIAPDYRTLGAYFFNNDMEELTANLSKTLFKGKVSFTGSGGAQRNNLAGELATNTARVVGAANISAVLTPTWNVSLQGSNFSSFLRVEQDVLSDSLNFYQVSRNLGGGITHLMGTDDVRHTVNLMVAYQVANARKEYSVDFDDQTKFYNVNLSYNMNQKPKGLTVGLNYTTGLNMTPDGQILNTGPVLVASKTFKDKKIKAGLSSSYLMVFMNGTPSSAVFNNKMKVDLNLWKHHGLGFTSAFLRRGATSTAPGFSEYQFNAAYTFRF